ncbi:TPA: hypothetical protein ACIJWR_004544 [Citrobacter sedlakii]
MKYWFVSDDAYFINSLEWIAEQRYPDSIFININKEWCGLNPAPEDIVIIAVDNNHLRSRLLRLPVLLRAKLFIVVDIPLTESNARYHFPCLVSKKKSVREFVYLLDNVAGIPPRQCVVPLRALNIFTQLSYGGSISEINAPPKLTTKSVYRIKRDMLQKYGLNKCNSVGVLICRDILEMSKVI